ncbi:unnamed protein product [Sphagnum balticum]
MKISPALIALGALTVLGYLWAPHMMFFTIPAFGYLMWHGRRTISRRGNGRIYGLEHSLNSNRARLTLVAQDKARINAENMVSRPAIAGYNNSPISLYEAILIEDRKAIEAALEQRSEASGLVFRHFHPQPTLKTGLPKSSAEETIGYARRSEARMQQLLFPKVKTPSTGNMQPSQLQPPISLDAERARRHKKPNQR